TTILVDCDRALYDAKKNQVVFSGENRPARFLEQNVDRNRAVKRTLYSDIERAILDRNTGHVTVPMSKKWRSKSAPFPSEGPLEFPNP
ncbi:MAG: hypothetical protein V1918_04785, partial [Planctomycetota bacterium]